MALSSMTGFARTSFEVDGAKFAWELKSVNARGLEIRLRLPAGFDHLEADIRTPHPRADRARQLFLRAAAGRLRAKALALVLNEEALALVVAAARRLAAVEGIAHADRRRPACHSRRASATAAPPSTSGAAERRDARSSWGSERRSRR